MAIAFDMQILGVNILRAQKEHIAYWSHFNATDYHINRCKHCDALWTNGHNGTLWGVAMLNVDVDDDG